MEIPGKIRKWLPSLRDALLVHKGVSRSIHGALLVKGNRAIIAVNQERNSEWAKRCGYYSLHAEAAVIHNVSREIVSGSTVVVVRVTRDGQLANSKPCSKCEKLLKARNVRRIFYSDAGGAIQRLEEEYA